MKDFHGFKTQNFDFYSKLDTKPTFADFDKETYFSTHFHMEYEIYLFLHGDVDYFVKDSFYHLSKNDLLIIPPTVYHYPKLRSNEPYHRITIEFPKSYLTEELCSTIDHLKIHHKIPTDSVIFDLYKNALLIVDRYEKQIVQSSLIHYLNLILTEITYLDKTVSNETPSDIHPLLNEILSFINSHLNIPLSLTTIANEFSITPTWLTHFFKKHMNISVMQYVTHNKILKAQQCIENGESPSVVASQFGFENYTTFYLQYKKIFGKSPSRYNKIR